MPPKYKVTKEEILSAAFGLLEAKGFHAVTTRAIAEKLGVSSRPFYSFFPSMENILGELAEQALVLMQRYMKQDYTSDPFLNMGVGFVCFYREKPRIAEFLEQKKFAKDHADSEKRMLDVFYESIKEKDEYQRIPKDDLKTIYMHMSIYTYGLVQYLKSSWIELSTKEIIDYLYEAGEARFVHYFWEKAGKPGKPENHW